MAKATFKDGSVIVDVILILILLVFVFPLLWNLITSFKDKFDIASAPPRIIFPPSWDNYRTVFADYHFLKYFRDSAIIAVSATVVALLFGSMAAYSIDRFKTGGKFLPFWILSNRMFPPVAIILPVFIIMRTLRLLDSYIGVILIYILLNLPFSVWLMWGFFREIPKEIDEAGYIDGCSILGVFFRLIIPVALPGIVATAIFCLITSWNEFLFALVLSGRHVTTVPVASAFFITDRDILWGPMAAVGVTASIPIVVFVILVQKHLVRGLSYGAVK